MNNLHKVKVITSLRHFNYFKILLTPKALNIRAHFKVTNIYHLFFPGKLLYCGLRGFLYFLKNLLRKFFSH